MHQSKAVPIISTVNSTGLTSSTVSQFNTAGNICPTAGLVLPARQLSDPILLPQTAPFSAVVTLKATSSEVLQPIPRLPCVVAGCRVVVCDFAPELPSLLFCTKCAKMCSTYQGQYSAYIYALSHLRVSVYLHVHRRVMVSLLLVRCRSRIFSLRFKIFVGLCNS